MTERQTSSGPLAGITVIELATFISVPFATMMLADLGATVIKVEPPTGDPFRRFGRPSTEISAVFVNSNRGKQSVCLDLKSVDGRAALLALVRTADVLVTNWRPAVADRLGLEDTTLLSVNPDLIRVYVSGFGATGVLSEQPVYDAIIQARTGLTDSQSSDDEPKFATTWIADKVAATMAAQTVLAAIIGRRPGVTPPRVDMAMLDAIAYFNFPDAFANRTFLHDAGKPARSSVASARPLRAEDGWFIVVPVSGYQIRRACEAFGHPEWEVELRATEAPEQLTATLFDLVESAASGRTVADCVATFLANDVPAAPCLTIDQHLSDEQVLHNGLYSVRDTAGIGPTRRVRHPASATGWIASVDGGPVPALGQHTAMVIKELEDRGSLPAASED